MLLSIKLTSKSGVPVIGWGRGLVAGGLILLDRETIV